MKITVHDANTLIDLINADLLSEWFDLDIKTYTTAYVIKEILEPSQKALINSCVTAGRLLVEDLDKPDDTLEIAVLLSRLKRNLSFEDCSVLLIAQRIENAILITGDYALRKIAEKENIESHGILWIFDILVKKGKINGNTAINKIELLIKKYNTFLPSNLVNDCKKRWKTSK